MSAWAKVGAKCVCVELPSTGTVSGGEQPVVGTVYTITRVGGTWWHDSRITIIALAELPYVNPVNGRECGYNTAHFRPLAYPSQSLEHDVSLFEQGHVSAPAKESA